MFRIFSIYIIFHILLINDFPIISFVLCTMYSQPIFNIQRGYHYHYMYILMSMLTPSNPLPLLMALGSTYTQVPIEYHSITTGRSFFKYYSLFVHFNQNIFNIMLLTDNVYQLYVVHYILGTTNIIKVHVINF